MAYRTDLEKQLDHARGWFPPDHTPTPTDLVMAVLGMDPSQDGLWLCLDGCGITHDHECDYGGWHSEKDAVLLTVTCENQEEVQAKLATKTMWGRMHGSAGEGG